jgi:hypothetical protein
VSTGEAGIEEVLRSRIAALETSLAMTTETLATTTESLTATRESLARGMDERDRLRRAYALLKEHYELLRRQIFAAKAERIDVTQLELEFAATKAKLDAMAAQLETPASTTDGAANAPTDTASDASPPPPPAGTKPASKPKGRRNLRDEDMPERRIEILDPALEGTVERIGVEESDRLGYQRPGKVRGVVACATYKQPVEATEDEEPVFELVTVKMPKEMVDRGLLAPSLIAHMLVSKYRFGIPFHRLSEMFRTQGVRVDDSMMCRYAEHVGATLGCIVDVCAAEAKATAFCLSTDATGVAIQPPSTPGRPRQGCRKGHLCAAGHKCPYAEPRLMRSHLERFATFGGIRTAS